MNKIYKAVRSTIIKFRGDVSESGKEEKKSACRNLLCSCILVPLSASGNQNTSHLIINSGESSDLRTDQQVTTTTVMNNGTLNISDGATITSGEADVTDPAALSLYGGARVTVSGEGSTFNVDGEMLFIPSGDNTAYMKILDGASMTVLRSGWSSERDNLNIEVKNNASLAIMGASAGDYAVAASGTISNGGTLYAGAGWVLPDNTSLTVQGGGSALTVDGVIKGLGSQINLQDGGKITADGMYINYYSTSIVESGIDVFPGLFILEGGGTLDVPWIWFGSEEYPSYVGGAELYISHSLTDYTLSPDLKGVVSANVENGTTNLTGDNKELSGYFHIAPLATVNIVSPTASGTASIYNYGTLQFTTGTDTTLSNDIYDFTGGGKINALNGSTTLTGDNSGYNGALNISAGAEIRVSQQNNPGNSVITNDGLLSIASQSDWTFSNIMSGTGTLNVNTGGNTFTFRNTTDTRNFTGTLALSDTAFTLDGDNTTVLSTASLRVGADSVVTVGNGTQQIKGMTFDGGIVDFSTIVQNAGDTDAPITVTDALDISGEGIVRIAISTDTDHISQVINPSLPLPEQDDDNAAIKLIDAPVGTVTGDGGSLQLQDASGAAVTSSQALDIVRNGNTVARGIYDFRLMAGPRDDGLYIGYGLTELDLLTSGAEALVLDADGKTGNAADMSARITGTGDLAFSSQNGETVSLSDQDNDYTGVTDIRGGNVLMNNNNVLGQTREVRLAADTLLDMNGHSQAIGKLNGAAGSTLNINGGNLTLTDGGVSAGTLTGSGVLNISGGMLDITGANHSLETLTTITEDAVVRMNDVSGLGNGDIGNAGTLSLRYASGTLGNNLSGTGTISLSGSDILLSGDNRHYSGLFTVDNDAQLTASAAEALGTSSVENDGTLVLNSTTEWQLVNDIRGAGHVRKTGSGSLTVGSNAAWTGQTDIDAGTLILGSADTPVMLASSLVSIAENGTLSGTGGVIGSVLNSGTIDLRADAPGNVLTTGGNYTGNNGTLLMNTVLGDDHSATDRLVIKGDASGQTRVAVTNAGGTGAQTLNGIELIHVDGNADSAEFVQAGRIAAGAYDYTLGRGQGSNSGNWHLTSGKNTPAPEPVPEEHDNDLRPEAGAYTASMIAANPLFMTRLHDR